MEKLKELYLSTFFLLNLESSKDSKPIESFISLLQNIVNVNNIESNLKAYADFIKSLKEKDFSSYLRNYYAHAQKEETQIILELSKIKYDDIKQILIDKFNSYSNLLDKLPEFNNSGNFDFIEKETRAYIFEDNDLKPVEYSETIKFKDLKGYVEQKRVLYENTASLIKGKKVNNILLYGDAGCGKSTSVRALINEFRDLKIVQIFKDNLINLDKLYSKLRDLPYNFIIFADDISFDESDKTISTMKAVLEGSIIQCPKNAVIYATSNRRHLVRESFQSRSGDEIHLNDTINEISSLSERFGINLLFQRPTNEEFIDIVLKLAADNNIDMPKEEIIARAQRLALIKGSKSPRIARQLIDNLVAGVGV